MGLEITRNVTQMDLYAIKGVMEHTEMLQEHMLKLVKQLLVTNTNFSIYVCAGESGIVYTALVYFLRSVLIVAQRTIDHM